MVPGLDGNHVVLVAEFGFVHILARVHEKGQNVIGLGSRDQARSWK